MHVAPFIPFPEISEGYSLSHHAVKRMRLRGLPPEALRAAIWYGRVVRIRAAEYYVIGHREISQCAREGIDLSAYEGVHVVCNVEGLILTVYRNRSLKHLRPHSRRTVPNSRRFQPQWHRRARR